MGNLVFKSSIEMAKLALAMDKDCENVKKKQYANINAKHDCCKEFKTITLWLCYLVTRNLI